MSTVETKNPKSRKRCPICKYRIRGKNHENGEHHKKAVVEIKRLFPNTWKDQIRKLSGGN